MSASAELSHLLSPVEVGPMTMRNRVVSTSHQTSLVDDHLPTEDLLAYHEARARGGVGAIFLEATAVHESGLLTDHTIGGFQPQIVGAYQRLGESVQSHGARLLVQLFHGGREQISTAPRKPTLAPSAIPSLRFKTEPRALSVTEIKDLIAGFATAAGYAERGGVDGVEVSMSHGYLAAQFMSPLSNRRRDAYGDDRLRFAHEVLEAVRGAVGERLAVGIRLSADELVPGGLDTEQAAEIATALHATGLVDFISLVLGNSASPSASTWIAPPPPTPENAIALPAAVIRNALPGATVLATTRVVDLAEAERLIADGTADLVGMTRALIADPELIAKTIDGRAEEVVECVGCNQSCIGHYHAGLPIGCAVNARTGRERTLERPVRAQAQRPREVLVIGGGPAGVAAALEAAARGDRVTLVEREHELGGQLRLAGRAPAHQEAWTRYARSTERRLRLAGIDLELAANATADRAAGFDAVVVATGAKPYASGPDGIQAWDAIRDPRSIASPALVADWGGGWDGLDAAECLAVSGIDVTLACAAPHPGETLHQYQRNLYLARLDELGVEILHHLELTASRELRHVFSGRTRPLPAQYTLVLAQGRVPDDQLWQQLESHPGAIRAGDVLGPRTLEEAVLEGTLAVR